MRCRKYQFLVGTDDDALLERDVALQRHPDVCVHCARFRQAIRALGVLMARVRPTAAPAGFADRVRARLRETEQVAAPSPLERMLGCLRAPAPTLQVRHAFAGVAIILAVLVLTAMLIQPLSGPPPGLELTVPSIAQPGGGQPVDYRSTEPQPFPRPAGGTSP